MFAHSCYLSCPYRRRAAGFRAYSLGAIHAAVLIRLADTENRRQVLRSSCDYVRSIITELFDSLTKEPISYIGPDFTQVLKKPEVEYRQANLTVAGMPIKTSSTVLQADSTPSNYRVCIHTF
jgi:hypothetical protein